MSQPGAAVTTAVVPAPDDPLVRGLLDRCRFPGKGTAVTCAVSGGADSTALLALAIAAELDVEVVHVDHRLRAGAADDAAHVMSLARHWGVPGRVVTASVAPGGDLEQRAREARRAALPESALFGHTADDQAETVLLRMLRGTGPVGLAAMRAGTHPLLALRRSETHDLCAHLGVRPRHDPTNEDPRFTRNRVRAEVLPLLDDVAERDVVPLLARLAELAAEHADLVDDLATSVDPTDVAALRAVPAPLAVAALRAWWRTETSGAPPPDRAATERMLDVVWGRRRGCDVVGGWSLRRTAGRLRLERSGPAVPDH